MGYGVWEGYVLLGVGWDGSIYLGWGYVWLKEYEKGMLAGGFFGRGCWGRWVEMDSWSMLVRISVLCIPAGWRHRKGLLSIPY